MTSPRKAPPFQKKSRIAIIGAGPAGAHMVYELSKRGFKNLTLFERTQFIGGQSHTVEVEGIPFDLGTLNYMNHYPVLDKLQREIDLDLVNIETMPKGIVNGQEISGLRFIFDRYDAENPSFGPRWFRYGRFLLKLKSDFKKAAALGDGLIDQYGFPKKEHLADLAKPTADFLRKHQLETLIYVKQFTCRAWGSIGPETLTAFQDFIGIKGPTSGPNRPVVKGGYQTVWEKLIERSTVEVEFGANVVSLEGTEQGVELAWQQSDGKQHQQAFDFAISSAPFPLKYLKNPTPNQQELFSKFNTHNQNPAIVTLYSADKSDTETVWLVSFHEDKHPFSTVCVGNEHVLQSPETYAQSNRVIKTALQCSFREKRFGDVSDEDFELAKQSLQDELENVYQERNVEILHQHVWGEYLISMSQEHIRQQCPWRLLELQSENRMWFIGVGACGPAVPNILGYNNMVLDLHGLNGTTD